MRFKSAQLACLLLLLIALQAGAAKPLPTPQLKFIARENVKEGGTWFVKFTLSIVNRNEFDAALFKAAPELPPCGSNKNSSRAWVDIYDGAEPHERLYGFCALTSSEDLGKLWFAIGPGKQLPKSVYVVITDRKTNAKVTSNTVALPEGTGG